MTTIIFPSETAHSAAHSEYSGWERYVLMRAYPTSIVLDLAAMVWSVYFLLEHNWQAAIGIVLVERLLSFSLLYRVNVKAMGETTLGRLALLHLHPINLLLQTVGLGIGVWGLWVQSAVYILVGVTLVIVGHAFGWSRVHPKLTLIHRP
jgi:fatty acid desaturase